MVQNILNNYNEKWLDEYLDKIILSSINAKNEDKIKMGIGMTYFLSLDYFNLMKQEIKIPKTESYMILDDIIDYD